MTPRTPFSIHKSLVEEVENITEASQLREIVKTLIKENLILSRKTHSALKSLDNQNNLIKYLHTTLVTMMSRHAEKAVEFWTIIGGEVLRIYDDFCRYQMIIPHLLNFYKLKDNLMKELEEALFMVSFNTVRAARQKVRVFLDHLAKEPREEGTNEQERNEERRKEEEVRKTKAKARRAQNDKINALIKKKKQQYSDMRKRRNAASTTPRKRSFSKFQRKSRIDTQKDDEVIEVVDVGETSQSETEGVQDTKKSQGRRQRKLKRKVGEMNRSSTLTSDIENSQSVVDKSVKKTKRNKRLRSAANNTSSSSINETVQLKPCFVKVNDFMVDSSVENDPFVARYKQANLCNNKDNEENEYEIVDDASGDEMDSDQNVESDHNSDNGDDNESNNNINGGNDTQQEDQASTKSEDKNIEQDTTVSKVIVVEEAQTSKVGDAQWSRNVTSSSSSSSTKKGPRTPPLSPVPEDFTFRRGPRTPSLSPPLARRGPRTPPGIKGHDVSKKKLEDHHSDG